MNEEEMHVLIDTKLLHCRAEVDRRINDDIGLLRGEIHSLRGDVSRISSTTDRMSHSLEKIADNMGKLAGLPDTWNSIKGFFRVMNWIRTNWIVFAILGGCIWISLVLLGVKVSLT